MSRNYGKNVNFIGHHIMLSVACQVGFRVLTTLISCCLHCGGGGALVFQAGYHPLKRTFKTHPNHIFSGVKIVSKYVFLQAFFLICPSCPFQNLSL